MEHINIVYTTDDNFIKQITTSMVSVYENNRDEIIDIYLLLKKVSEQNKSILKATAQQYGRVAHLIDLKDMSEYFGKSINTGGWNDIVLSRLFLDKLLPEDINRVLYLDGDTITRGSLKELWAIDMQDKVLGAVIEPVTSRNRKLEIGLGEYDNYYNAGVLLIDLNKWKQKDAGNRIINFYKLHDYNLFANDQDAINGELKDEIYPLDIKYNYSNTFYYYPYRFLDKLINSSWGISKKEYYESANNPCIVHYLGEERPWREGNKHQYRDDYIKYFRKTFFSDDNPESDGIIEPGWKRYFVFWNLFNLIVRPFPALRLFIITKGIPVFMGIRKRKLDKNDK